MRLLCINPNSRSAEFNFCSICNELGKQFGVNSCPCHHIYLFLKRRIPQYLWHLKIIHYNLVICVSQGSPATTDRTCYGWTNDRIAIRMQSLLRSFHSERLGTWACATLPFCTLHCVVDDSPPASTSSPEITFGTYPHFTCENMSVVAFWMQFISEWLQIKLILNLTKHDVLMQWGFHRSLSRSSTTHVCKLISLRELNPNSTNSY